MFYVQTLSTYDRSIYDFLTLQCCKSYANSVEAVLRTLSFGLFLSQLREVPYANDAGQQGEALAPNQLCNQEGEQPLLYRLVSVYWILCSECI